MFKGGIQTKVLVLALLGVLGMCAVLVIGTLQQRSVISEERADHVRSSVEIAAGVLTYYGGEEQAGRLTRAEAQKRALAEIRSLRYSGKEYFWINDFDARVIMHPIKPELDGTDQSQNKDPNGVPIFAEFARVGKAEGQGFVEYEWPKPGAKDPQPKVSYVVAYQPWGWVVGSGVYVDDIGAATIASAGKMALWTLPFVLLVGIVAWLLARGIIRPIRDVVERLRDSDVRHRFPVKGDGTVLDDLNAALNTTLAKVGDVVDGIRGASSGLVEASSTLSGSGERIARAAEDTSGQADRMLGTLDGVRSGVDVVATGTDEMRDSIHQIAGSAQAAARVAADAVTTAQATNQAVARLGEASQEISSVVLSIGAIAEQTNLLALNATIEAARAGEAGKGFAVVASEVKDLAQESARASEDIQHRVEAMQAEVASAVAAIGEISRIIGEINDHQAAIAGAVEEQTATTQEMSRNTQVAANDSRSVTDGARGLVGSAERTVDEAAQVREAASRLEAMSRELERSVAVFS